MRLKWGEGVPGKGVFRAQPLTNLPKDLGCLRTRAKEVALCLSLKVAPLFVIP